MSNLPSHYGKLGFSPYAVIESRGGVRAIIVSASQWGCKLMFEAYDGFETTAVEMANYPWLAIVHGNFKVVG